jgi:uncharacterized protein YjiS (DUF1127 family)
MSKHLRTVPSVFLHYHGLTLPQRAVDRTQLEGGQLELQQKRDGSCQHQASFVVLRDDHVVLLAIDALLALHASFKKWRNRRRTLLALGDLDDRQLRDIGLIRDGDQYRSLAGSDED